MFNCLERKCVHLHLLEHRAQAVASGGGEVLAQADTVDEVEVGIQNLLRRVVGQDSDQQSNDALDNECIALCPEL